MINASSSHKELDILFLTHRLKRYWSVQKASHLLKKLYCYSCIFFSCWEFTSLFTLIRKGQFSLGGPDRLQPSTYSAVFLPSSFSSRYSLICNHVSIHLQGKTKQTTEITLFSSICHIFASVSQSTLWQCLLAFGKREKERQIEKWCFQNRATCSKHGTKKKDREDCSWKQEYWLAEGSIFSGCHLAVFSPEISSCTGAEVSKQHQYKCSRANNQLGVAFNSSLFVLPLLAAHAKA